MKLSETGKMAKKAGIGFLLFIITLLWSVDGEAQDEVRTSEQPETSQSETEQLRSQIEEIKELNDRGKTGEARKVLDRSLAEAESLGDPALVQAVEKEFGEYYILTNKLDSAKVILQSAAERKADADIQIEILNLLATAYRYQADYEQALSSYNQALSMADSVRHRDYLAAINANKAGVFENLGDYSQAVSLYQDGIEFAEADGDSSFLATALNNLGNLYNEMEEFEEAIGYLEEALTVGNAIDKRITLLRARTNLGISYSDLGNFDKAKENYDRALSLHEELRPDTPPFQLTHNLGKMYLAQGQTDSAEAAFRESMDYSEQMGVPEGRFHNLISLAELAEQQGDIQTAADRASRAMKAANEIGSGPFRINASEMLYLLNKESGNAERALQYHELFKSVSDSLNEVQQDQQLATAETELALRRQKQINQLLENEQQEQEARIATQNWLIAASAAVILVVLLFLYLLYRSNSERRRMNEKLQKQRHKLEDLNDVKDKILAILAHDLRSPLASMKGMVYLIQEDYLSRHEIEKMSKELEVSLNQNISMLDNLLAWAQDQMSGLKISTKKINAADIVDEVQENYELQSSQKAINLISRVDGEVSVQADEDLLRLILRNLISNGIKFTDEGGRVVIEHHQEPDKVYFTIRDTGVGIPDEKVDTLFSGDFESQKGTQNEKGSGLGLRLVHEFVDKLGGELSIESKKGKGTAVTFSLPKG